MVFLWSAQVKANGGQNQGFGSILITRTELEKTRKGSKQKQFPVKMTFHSEPSKRQRLWVDPNWVCNDNNSDLIGHGIS